jgi:hypothetical protein
MPEQTRKDWEVEVKAAVGKIGPARGADLEARTKSVTKDLMGKLPEANKVYLEQMMFATYCSALRDDKNISETEKGNRIKAYNSEVRRTLYGQQGQPRSSGSSEKTRQQTTSPQSKDQEKLRNDKMSIVGVLPLHVWETKPGPESSKFTERRLGMIVKLRNDTNISPRVNVAVIEGCVRFDPLAASGAEEILLEGETLPNPLIFDETLSKLRQSTIQRIRVSGHIRQESRDVPGLGMAYIGVLFPLLGGRTGAIVLEEPKTVSLKGNCEAIKNASTQPGIYQLVTLGPDRTIRDLAPEFRDGRLKIRLHVGSEILEVNPKILGELKSISWKSWSSLALPQMFEVPESGYPPTVQ